MSQLTKPPTFHKAHTHISQQWENFVSVAASNPGIGFQIEPVAGFVRLRFEQPPEGALLNKKVVSISIAKSGIPALIAHLQDAINE